jgi:hypothetical protein
VPAPLDAKDLEGTSNKPDAKDLEGTSDRPRGETTGESESIKNKIN